MNKKLKKILLLDKKLHKAPKLSLTEKDFLESEQRFEATYYSNKLEGNKLGKDEARKAILSK
ncbi:MAG: hypothetical protein AAB482_00795 [Patescibacteria group bacterium]